MESYTHRTDHVHEKNSVGLNSENSTVHVPELQAAKICTDPVFSFILFYFYYETLSDLVKLFILLITYFCTFEQFDYRFNDTYRYTFITINDMNCKLVSFKKIHLQNMKSS